LGDDQPTGLAVDESGNVYVTGQGNTGSRPISRLWPYSASGIPLWTNRYEAPASTANGAAGIAVDRYGNVYVTGYSRTGGATADDIITIKYSTDRPYLTITSAGDDSLLRVNGLPGTVYRLERAISLNSPWQTIDNGNDHRLRVDGV
jgi:outer membrane protein assembly factor BamB